MRKGKEVRNGNEHEKERENKKKALFLTGVPRAADEAGRLGAGLEQPRQSLPDLVHDGEEGGVHVAEERERCWWLKKKRLVEVEEVEVEGEEKATAATAAKRKRHSCAPGGGGQEATPLMAPVVLTNRCNGLCDPLVSLVDLHADPSCRAPTLGAEGVGVGGGLPAGGAGGPSAAVRALPLGDFWSYGRGLSRADAVALECIRFTAEGDVDKSACNEGKKAEKKRQRR